MKKLIITLVVLFVLYVIYYDLSEGVLSTPASIVLFQETKTSNPNETISKKEEKKNGDDSNFNNKEKIYYKEIKVSAGQTVLSIVEQIHNGPLPVSISQLITDFQLLNPKTEPERIQLGKSYKFPVYEE